MTGAYADTVIPANDVEALTNAANAATAGQVIEAYAGRPSWRGIAFGWFNARFGGKGELTVDDKREFLDRLDDTCCQNEK